MRDEVGGREVIQPEHLELLLRIGREIVIRECELSSFELKSMVYWINSGMVVKNKRKNVDEPTEDEFHYCITDQGEYYCLNYRKIFN